MKDYFGPQTRPIELQPELSLKCFLPPSAPYHPGDTLILKTASTRQIIISCNVTWKILGAANVFPSGNVTPGANKLDEVMGAEEAVLDEVDEN